MQGKNGEDFAICGVEMSLSGGVYPAVHARTAGITPAARCAKKASAQDGGGFLDRNESSGRLVVRPFIAKRQIG
jgi:hypothetical protein